MDSSRKSIGVFNPNQRQFFEDELRNRVKLEQLHAGLINEIEIFNYLLENLSKINCIQSDNSSPTHLYIRPKEDEYDVDLLDEYDSFYKTTKSLLVLFQIMGIMPIKRSAPGMGVSHYMSFQIAKHKKFTISSSN